MFVKEEAGGTKEKMRNSLLVCFESRPPFSFIQVAFRSFLQLNVQPGEVAPIEEVLIFWNTIATKIFCFYPRNSSFGGRQGQSGGQRFEFLFWGFFFFFFNFVYTYVFKYFVSILGGWHLFWVLPEILSSFAKLTIIMKLGDSLAHSQNFKKNSTSPRFPPLTFSYIFMEIFLCGKRLNAL